MNDMVSFVPDTAASPVMLFSFCSILFRSRQQNRSIQGSLSQISQRKDLYNRQFVIYRFENNVVA
jgi:hypothetical protein